MTVEDAKGKPFSFDQDERLRPDTTLETLGKLKAPFQDGGSVTAGNASGVNDGAAALLIASEAGARANGLTPQARARHGQRRSSAENDGNGPRARLAEADGAARPQNREFRSDRGQRGIREPVIACLRQLEVYPASEHVNPQRGGIALKHPLGMSGARLALAATHALEKSNAGRALFTLCVGVGQVVAVALEREVSKSLPPCEGLRGQ